MEASRILTKPRRAFSLLELLVSMAVLAILVTTLFSILSQASRLFSQGEAMSDALSNLRAASFLMSQDIQGAVLPIDRTNQTSLQFILNPQTVPQTYKNRDAIFWQTSNGSDENNSGVSVVGYFVKWDNSDPANPHGKLCRLFVNSKDTLYRIYTDPNQWISDGVISDAAPATKADNYRGLLAENVIGMWIEIEERDPLTKALRSVTSFDSRTNGKLPIAARVSFAFISPSAAKRLTPSDATAIRNLYSGGITNFIANLPPALRPDARIYTTRVLFP